jgi:hypothetical protein
MAHTNCTFQSVRHTRILNSKASAHAAKRLQQRGISNSCISLILAFGSQEHDGQGGVRYLMTTSAMEKVFATLGRTQQIASLTGQYAVVSSADNTIITVGHRYQ